MEAKKETTFSFRCTEKEKKGFQQKAEKNGMKASDYVRDRANSDGEGKYLRKKRQMKSKIEYQDEVNNAVRNYKERKDDISLQKLKEMHEETLKTLTKGAALLWES